MCLYCEAKCSVRVCFMCSVCSLGIPDITVQLASAYDINANCRYALATRPKVCFLDSVSWSYCSECVS